MSVYLFSNNAGTTLAGPIAATATTINLAAGTGVLFPVPAVGQQFALTLISQSDANEREIVYCTARNGDSCTVIRGQENTPATAFIAGDFARNLLTAATTAAFIQSGQLQIQATNYGVDFGSANNIQVSLNPQPGSLVLISGSPIRILIAATNTGPTTLTISGLATTTVIMQNGLPLTPGIIVGGQIYEFFYNPGVGFEVSSPFPLLGSNNSWAGTQTYANTANLLFRDTGGTARPILGYSSSDQTILHAGTGATPFVLSSQAGATIAYADGSNNFNVTNTLLAGGPIRGAGLVTTSGQVSSSVGTMTITPGASGFTLSNQANTSANLTMTDQGNAAIPRGSLTVGTAIVAGTSVSGQSVFAANGNVTANNGHLRASLGAVNSGDNNAATILSDFAGGNGFTTFPSTGWGTGLIFQWGIVTVPENNTPTTFDFPEPFPVQCLAMTISYGALTPPASGSVGAQSVNRAQFLATNTSTVGGNNGCFFFAIGV